MGDNKPSAANPETRVGTEKGRASSDDTLTIGKPVRAVDGQGKPLHSSGALGLFHVSIEGSLNSPGQNIDEFKGKPLSKDGKLTVPEKMWLAVEKKAAELFERMLMQGVVAEMVVGLKDYQRLENAGEHAGTAMILAQSMGSSLKEGPDGRITGTFDGRLDAADSKAPSELVLKAAAQILRDSGMPDVKVAPASAEMQSGCGKPTNVPEKPSSDVKAKCATR
jgi:hypothetical protein